MSTRADRRPTASRLWRTALVTGASAGIGEALALELAGRGVSVGLLARREDRLRELAGRLAARAPAARFPIRVADVAEVDGLIEALDELWSELDGVDLFIANAGVGRSTPALSTGNAAALREILAINVTGTLAGLEHLKNRMMERGSGHLVGLSSLAAGRGLPAVSVYCASKAAVTTYLEALAVELPQRGIWVSNVRPGYVRTDMTAGGSSMPLLLDVDVAARTILRGLERRRFDIAFPRASAAFMGLLSRMPYPLYFRLARRFREV